MIFEEYLKNQSKKKEESVLMPGFIKNMCEEYDKILNSPNFSHPLFEKILPFFVYHTHSAYMFFSLHCTHKKIPHKRFVYLVNNNNYYLDKSSNKLTPSNNSMCAGNDFIIYGDLDVPKFDREQEKMKDVPVLQLILFLILNIIDLVKIFIYMLMQEENATLKITYLRL